MTFLLASSMMEIVPSCAFAAQSSLLSGETSKPSAPLPTATTVWFQSGPPGLLGPPGPLGLLGGGPPGAPGPGGGPKPPAGPAVFSIMLTVAELTLDVKIR